MSCEDNSKCKNCECDSNAVVSVLVFLSAGHCRVEAAVGEKSKCLS